MDDPRPVERADRRGADRRRGDLYQRLEEKRMSLEAERRAYARRAIDRRERATGDAADAHTDPDTPRKAASSD
jgi:hypothetical protein